MGSSRIVLHFKDTPWQEQKCAALALAFKGLALESTGFDLGVKLPWLRRSRQLPAILNGNQQSKTVLLTYFFLFICNNHL